MNKAIFAALGLLLIVILAVPAILVTIQAEHASDPAASRGEAADPQTDVPLLIDEDTGHIPVFLTGEARIAKVPLEAYIRGVVAAEMPADFHLEALKAQALAARTYIIDRARRQDFSDMTEQYGEAADGAWVSDTVRHQVYCTDEQLRENWGGKYRSYVSRVNRAVNETKGRVITYGGEPIYAAFFSTSNGKTENSEDYWEDAYPYLRSVDSPWDKDAPSFEAEPAVFALAEFTQTLEQQTKRPIAVTAAGGDDWIQVIEKTEGGSIATLKIGDQTFTGREVREALGLRSADFTWEIDGDRIAITARGYGHGVGMSQWGANLMAADGKTAEDIIEHYYRGVTVEEYDRGAPDEDAAAQK